MRAYATNSAGTSYSDVVTFKTADPPLQVLSVTPTSLDFGESDTEKFIEIKNIGVGMLKYSATTTQAWIVLGKDATDSLSAQTKNIRIAVSRSTLSPGDYSGNVNVGSNNNPVVVSVKMKVATPVAPTVTSGQASGITTTAAQVSGNVTALGNSPVTQHGHCWSVNANPTVSDSKTALGSVDAAKAFSSSLSGLTASTTYYVRAYATNSAGTSYSDAITFKTLDPAKLATVQSSGTSNVTHNSLDATGNLTVLGDVSVTDYGFCYSSSNATPTISDSKAGKGETTQTGEYKVSITNLQPSTKYYLRAYAINSIGTAYGSVIEATTTAAPPVVMGGLAAYYTFDDNTVDDITGNGYDGSTINSPDYITDTPDGTGKAVFLKKANSQKLTLPNPVQVMGLSRQLYTICFWIKDAGTGNIFCGAGGSGRNELPSMQIDANGKFYINGKSFDGANILQDGDWHHVAVSFAYYGNAINWSLSLYVDGGLYGNTTNVEIFAETPSIYFGGNNTYGGLQATNFKVDNIRIYARLLSAAEVKQIYNAKQ